MAPGLALGRVGETIEDVGGVLAAHNERILEVENASDLTEIQSRLKTAYADFQESLLTDHDYKGYRERWDGTLEELRGELEEGEFSPMVRDQARLLFTEFEGNTRIGVSEAAQRKAVERSRQAFNNAYQGEMNAYNPATGEGGDIEGLLAMHSYLTPEQKDEMRTRFADEKRRKDDFFSVHEDPAAWREDHPNPGAMDPGEWANLDARAKRLIGEQLGEQTRDITDAIVSGDITDPAQIDDLAPDMRPALREELKGFLEDHLSGQREADLRNPRVQHEITGELFGLLESYNPTGEGFDHEMVRIESLLAQLGDGPARKEFKSQFDRIKSGELSRVRTVKDLGLEAIRRAGTAGAFGATEAPEIKRTVGDYLDDGFLRDWSKLRTLGIEDEASKSIAKETDRKKQVELFREAYLTRDKSKETAGEFEQSLARQLRDSGSLSTVFSSFRDPAFDGEASQRATGRAVADYLQWAAVTDNPTEAQVAEKVKSLTGREMEAMLRTVPARRGGGIPHETSSIGTFGGHAILPAGESYQGRATVFGGANDPADNGRSAFGGTTGAGGREGAAIPLDVLRATFPGRDKAWLVKNVEVEVSTGRGRKATLPLADLGTAEWVWRRAGGPVLDLTEGAVRKLGGRPTYDKRGQLSGMTGIGMVNFTLKQR